MIYLFKRWLKKRVSRDSLVWRTATTVSAVVFYPRTLYRRYSRSSIFNFESEMDMCSLFPQGLLDEAIRIFQPRSVLDLGCGTGRSLEYFHERGIDVFGLEGSELAISKAAHPELIRKVDLNHEVQLRRKFDLVWSYEVVEHIHPDYVQSLMRTFSNHGDNVVLSAARPGQGGQGHFNEQPPEYWIARFAEHGYTCDQDATRRLRAVPEEFSANMLAFRRSVG
ncbi:MAG TPA: class I SAM-dependent methyltransferase [Longimicrobium sp.]|nr:class I SAM-dependent methyltransferase [Longimicrobium sp.]